jgi:hypothetical protein
MASNENVKKVNVINDEKDSDMMKAEALVVALVTVIMKISIGTKVSNESNPGND